MTPAATSKDDYRIQWGHYYALAPSLRVARIGSIPEDRYSVPLDLELPEWRDRANAEHDEWVCW